MTCLHIDLPPQSPAIPTLLFTSYHYLCSYHLPRLTHPLQKCKRIRLLHWNEVKSACGYRFYNQTDWSSNSGSATYHVNLDRFFNLSDPPFAYDNTTLQIWWEINATGYRKHPPQCPACNLFSANASSPPPAYPRPAAHRRHETWAPLRAASPGCTNIIQTPPSITAGRTALSISEHTYFLISFPLSGFTFITSECYLLSSTREFMLPSSIHLPTPSANSHWSKDLIF